ncbi:hypothetical protein Ctob_011783 [Chrysochromulina tobinii]|uniref:Uncharacterized protein n=1 Tax=Chrysochromulina tobinii TaxID=1460289 RepID=A0A0M0K5N2_9EUKA|nr:hypothetical protein Ctob_011783 [Chrysochromulina tobinii]|eukprot:KOO33907.1 hypothetical protein Ctob_011783 [Chrysochromulina sp. CCMP291]
MSAADLRARRAGTVTSSSDVAALRAAVANTNAKVASLTPFDDSELDRLLGSLRELAGQTAGSIDWVALRELYRKSAHKNYKDWTTTAADATELQGILGTPNDAAFQTIFKRVLGDGNFEGAVRFATSRAAGSKPFIVLVSGLNGIRKTTSVHQPWFQACLASALEGQGYDGPVDELPCGANSFFRQLDFMLTTLAANDFATLFELEEVGLYAEVKASIFARFRTSAEMLGVLLVRAAQAKGANVMVETSGRDVGMYKYIDALFPEDHYQKLVIHFSINELRFAEMSVDTRMAKEMADGAAALAAQPGAGLNAIIRANAGGPYGSQVLKGVQADSDALWAQLRRGEAGDVAKSWLKASIGIEAHAEQSAKKFAESIDFPADLLFADTSENVDAHTAIGTRNTGRDANGKQIFEGVESMWSEKTNAALKARGKEDLDSIVGNLFRPGPYKPLMPEGRGLFDPKVMEKTMVQGGTFVYDGATELFAHYDFSSGDHADLNRVVRIATEGRRRA